MTYLYPWMLFLGYLLGNFTETEITYIRKAFFFARKAHHGKNRLDGSPYFNHVVCAALFPLSLRVYDVDLIVTILLHDTVEESKAISHALLQRLFGIENANRVLMLTKPKNKSGEFYFMSLLGCDDWRVLLAKLFDRLHNQQTISAGKPAWQKRKNKETVRYFPRILKRAEAQVLLAIQKKKVSKEVYGTVCEEIRKLYLKVIPEPYKHYFKKNNL